MQIFPSCWQFLISPNRSHQTVWCVVSKENFSRGGWGHILYLRNFRKGGGGRGLKKYLENGKSWGWGVQIPSVARVWIFPGTTHFFYSQPSLLLLQTGNIVRYHCYSEFHASCEAIIRRYIYIYIYKQSY